MENAAKTVIKEENAMLSMIEKACIDSTFSVEKLERLLKLKEREDERIAKKEFFLAFCEFKRNCPTIVKRSTIDAVSKSGARYKTKFADLQEIDEKTKGVLADNQLSYRFTQAEDGNKITVTCVITHSQGHSESTSLTGNVETTPGQPAIQAKGIIVSYLMRYTLKCALGLTTADEDTDGNNEMERISNDQEREINNLLTETGSDMTRFLNWMKVNSVRDIAQSQYKTVIESLKRKKTVSHAIMNTISTDEVATASFQRMVKND